jgi:hypothetical protein
MPLSRPRIRPTRARVVAIAGTAIAVLATAALLTGQPAHPTWAPRCTIFPAGNVWNRSVTDLPVLRNSRRLLASIGVGSRLHPDFSNQGSYGIPINVATARTPRYRVSFLYRGESDRGPYPIPATPKIEGGSDRHLLVVDRDACRLYELYDAARIGNRWTAGSGAIWNLSSNALRPAGWTSADAAGLPIVPGLVRYDEIQRGAILHALRFTAPITRRAFIYPARHQAGSTNSAVAPPMGLRLRLKRSVSLRGFSPQVRIILIALRDYGMILADNGSPLYVSGTPDRRWNDDQLHQLSRLTGADFEVVDTTRLRNR